MIYSASFCIHMKTMTGSYYEPSESWCELNSEYGCDDCPDRYSKEDYYNDRADYEYDRYRDSLEF